MPQAFTVRLARASDVPALAHHRAAMFRDMGRLSADAAPELERETAGYLAEAMPRGEYFACVAEDQATAVIGGAGVQLRRILPRPRDGGAGLERGPEGIIVNVYVEPDWRRRGVAEAIMRALLDALSARGVRRIVLHASDQGRRLYERLGFVQTNEMRRSSHS